MAKGDQLPIFSSSGSPTIPETAHGIQAISTQPVKPDFKAHAVHISSQPQAWITAARFLYDLHYRRLLLSKLCIAHRRNERQMVNGRNLFAYACHYDLRRPAVENRAVDSRNHTFMIVMLHNATMFYWQQTLRLTGTTTRE